MDGGGTGRQIRNRLRRSSLHGLALEHRADAEADPSAVGREKGFAAALFPDRRGQHLTRAAAGRSGLRLPPGTRTRASVRPATAPPSIRLPHCLPRTSGSPAASRRTTAATQATCQPVIEVAANQPSPRPAARAPAARTAWPGAWRVAGTAGARSPPRSCSRSSRASPISRSRRRGSFSRQRRSSRRIGCGVPAGNADQSGSRSRMAAIVSETVAPANACGR